MFNYTSGSVTAAELVIFLKLITLKTAKMPLDTVLRAITLLRFPSFSPHFPALFQLFPPASAIASVAKLNG